MPTIDCRGMSCPQPVITVKRALEQHQGSSVTILLDDGAPHENVCRFLRNRGVVFTDTASADGYTLEISGATGDQPGTAPVQQQRVVLITSDKLGTGAEELGRLLLKNFIISLLDQTDLPSRMLFMNSGIFLTTEGSEVLSALLKLEHAGVEILSCGLCLDYYQKKQELRVGGVTNMFTTVEALLQNATVINL
jgi:selenium metabolism protein YedF